MHFKSSFPALSTTCPPSDCPIRYNFQFSEILVENHRYFSYPHVFNSLSEGDSLEFCYDVSHKKTRMTLYAFVLRRLEQHLCRWDHWSIAPLIISWLIMLTMTELHSDAVSLSSRSLQPKNAKCQDSLAISRGLLLVPSCPSWLLTKSVISLTFESVLTERWRLLPGSAAGRISPSHEIKQRMPFLAGNSVIIRSTVHPFSVHKILINNRSSSVRCAVFTSRLRHWWCVTASG